MDVDADLHHQGIREGELGQGKTGDGELADADQPDAELGEGEDSAAACLATAPARPTVMQARHRGDP